MEEQGNHTVAEEMYLALVPGKNFKPYSKALCFY